MHFCVEGDELIAGVQLEVEAHRMEVELCSPISEVLGATLRGSAFLKAFRATDEDSDLLPVVFRCSSLEDLLEWRSGAFDNCTHVF